MKIIQSLLITIILVLSLTSMTVQATDMNLIEYDKLWMVKIYYITQNDIYDNKYQSIIDNGMNKANQILKDYDNTSFKWDIEKVDIPSDINIGSDIFIGFSNEGKLIRSIPNFKLEYNNHDITFFIIHGTTGGAYSVNYMSPIWFSWSAFEKDIDNLDGMGIAHEFLHTFGLRDINGGQEECIMGDLYLSKLNLCDQNYLFKPENYKKTPLSEWFIDTESTPTSIPTPILTPTSISMTIPNDIFQILDEKYIDNITDLPYSTGIPDKNIQSSNHIRGWIDIVGFNKMSRDNNIYYVPGKPEKYAIVQEDAWGKFDCDTCGYSIKKNVQVISSGIYTISIFDIKMTWYEKVCTKSGCSCIEHKESATFYDSEESPQIIYPLIEPEIKITQYNNTLYENVGIQVMPKDIENISRLDVYYNDSSIRKTFKIGYVEITRKGIYFANITEMPIWSDSNKNITRLDNTIFINGNLTDIGVNSIKVSTSNLYETKYHTNFTISREEFRPEKETIENLPLMTFWSIILVMFGGLCFTIIKMRII